MRCNLLGDLELITDDGRRLSVSAPKVSTVLALLMLRRGDVVTFETLMRELWGDRRPRSAATTLQTYVYHARKVFEKEGVTTRVGSLIETRQPGYIVQRASVLLDIDDFERLAALGAAELSAGRPEAALPALTEALALWRGAPLAGIARGQVLNAYAAHLGERRLAAIETRIVAERRLGRCRQVIPELRALVSAHPLREWFYGQLIDALHQSGRRAEAIQVYRDLCRVLREELGTAPTLRLDRLHLGDAARLSLA